MLVKSKGSIIKLFINSIWTNIIRVIKLYDRVSEFNIQNKKRWRITIKPWLLYKKSENTKGVTRSYISLIKTPIKMAGRKMKQRQWSIIHPTETTDLTRKNLTKFDAEFRDPGRASSLFMAIIWLVTFTSHCKACFVISKMQSYHHM